MEVLCRQARREEGNRHSAPWERGAGKEPGRTERGLFDTETVRLTARFPLSVLRIDFAQRVFIINQSPAKYGVQEYAAP